MDPVILPSPLEQRHTRSVQAVACPAWRSALEASIFLFRRSRCSCVLLIRQILHVTFLHYFFFSPVSSVVNYVCKFGGSTAHLAQVPAETAISTATCPSVTIVTTILCTSAAPGVIAPAMKDAAETQEKFLELLPFHAR